jgi:16S rRNA (uracil1498-N3)-methyltransferase
MRISRIYTDSPLEPDQQVSLKGQAGHYLFRVLKLRAGDPLVLFNGDGSDYAAELISNRRDRVELRVSARLPSLAESGLNIVLAQAIGKGDRMDYSLQKATELGVAAIRPMFTERTEVRLKGDRLQRRLAHWQRVVISACEQSGRAVVPELLPAQELTEWLDCKQDSGRLVLDPTSRQSLASFTFAGKQLELLVGPEGGFSELELKQLKVAGVVDASLGPRVLRTETAGPSAIAVLQALHGDLA